MYKISSIDSTGITLSKNDKWWNIKNINSNIETIQIKLYSEMGELYNSFKLGNIDIFTTSNTNIQQYIGTIGYALSEYKGREFDYLSFNCQDGILMNKEVRKAIYYAINKANIVSSIYNNQYYISDFPLDYGNFLYNKEISDQYNLDQAKQILTKNGWEYKNSRWQKKENGNTLKLTLNLTVNAENATRTAAAENIKASLEQIGIKVALNKVSGEQYNNILENKNYQMILTGVYNSYSPNIETFLGNNNLQNYSNDEVNTIINEVKSITDTGLLKEKYKRIIEIYEEDRPFVGLYRNKGYIVKGQTLAGEVRGNNYFSYFNLDTWHRF